LIRTKMVPMRYGGVVSRRVSMLFLPRPAMTLFRRFSNHNELVVVLQSNG
jgi:hypothetical protein